MISRLIHLASYEHPAVSVLSHVGDSDEQVRRTLSKTDMAIVGHGMPSILMDRSRAPLIKVTLSGEVTDQAFDKYLRDSNEVLSAQRRYVLLFDAIRDAHVSARIRRLQVDWIKANEDRLRKLCLGCAFCFDSAVTRGALTAVLWMARLPFEYTIMGNRQQAIEWVHERLRNASIVIS